MKLPSLQKLQQATVRVVFRFPLEIFCAAVGTVFSLWLIERDTPEEYLLRLILCSILGLALFLSATIFSESRSLSKKQRSILQVAAALVLVACWLAIKPVEDETSIIRYSLLVVAFHLLVSCAPKTTIAGFWEYNKQLFIRILTAQLYSWVLYAGLCIAVASSDFLFNLDLDYKIYLRLYVVILGLFNTIFFLAGVPDTFDKLEHQYPRGLKVFTQYVLIPLATIYLCIILAYEGKVIVEWSLPKGIISWLILGYGVYGILSILLVYPVRLLEENKWISTYSKLFYFLLVPLLPLLYLAIGLRVMDYGVTELRYIVSILALWLTGITIYFLISKTQNIKVIPATLALLALLSAWGPQSASSVSERSQVNRLIQLFQLQDSFKNGLLQPMPRTIPDSIGNETLNQLQFVTEHYGVNALKHVLSATVKDSLLQTDTITERYSKRYAIQEVIRKGLALQAYYAASTYPNIRYYQAASSLDSVTLDGYVYMKAFTHYSYDVIKKAALADDTLTFEGKFQFDLSKLLEAIEHQQKTEGEKYPNQLPVQKMTAEPFEKKDKMHKLIISKISYSKDSLKRTLQDIEGIVLFQ